MMFTALMLFLAQSQAGGVVPAPRATGFYGFTMNSIEGEPVPLEQYKGKVVMVVNVASKCGLTPQYESLEAIYRKYKDRGFVVLGFPANNFGNQEPGTNEEILEFCTGTYDVSFPMFAKISVKGADQHPLYAWLVGQVEPNDPIEWNFAKFLVGRDGQVIARFGSRTRPDDPMIVSAIEQALGG